MDALGDPKPVESDRPVTTVELVGKVTENGTVIKISVPMSVIGMDISIVRATPEIRVMNQKSKISQAQNLLKE